MNSNTFRIGGLSGEKRLFGAIPIMGAKNAATKAFAASLLFENELSLSNVPQIADVEMMKEILTDLGVKIVQTDRRSYAVDTQSVSKTHIDYTLGKKMRSSAVLIGPMLARFGKVKFPHPGGCVIGARPIDLFLKGFMQMGAEVNSEEDYYTLKGKLKGADIFFDTVSVGATETLMMAAVLASGTTILRNAAMEPEIADIAHFLNKSGAKIEGVGTPTLVIDGVSALQAKEAYEALPDRIEAGSFLILGVLSAKELSIENCNPSHLRALISALKKAGANIEEESSRLIVKDTKTGINAINVKTHEYPGFATDLQAPMTVLLTQAEGESMVFETIFDGRLNYVEDLILMGADITVFDPHRILIRGPRQLRGKDLTGPDLRAGLAYLLAAVSAKGESELSNVHFIDRGYENIEERLSSIGVAIERIDG